MKKLLARLAAVALALLLLAVVLVAVNWSNWMNQARDAVIRAAETKIEGKITIEQIDVSWPGGVRFRSVTILDKQGETVAVAPQVALSVNYAKLLAGGEPMAAVSEVQVDDPVLTLVQKAGQWNAEGLIKKQEEAEPAFYGRVLVQNGRVLVRTEKTQEMFTLEGSLDAGERPDYKLAATIGIDGESVDLSGRIDRSGNGELRAGVKRLDIARMAKLAADQLPVALQQGWLCDAQIKLSRSGGNAVWQGRGRLEGAQAEVSGRQVRADGRFSLDGHDLLLDKVNVRLDAAPKPLVVSGRITGVLDGEINGASVDVSGESWPVSALRGWVPETALQHVNSDLILNNFWLTGDWQGQQLMLNAAKANIDSGSLQVSGSYAMDSGALQASGEWSALDPARLTPDIDGRLWQGETAGRINISGNAKTQAWQGEAVVTAAAAQVGGVSAAALQAEASLSTDGVFVGSASGNIAGGSFFATGGKKAQTVAGHLELAGVQLAQLAAPFNVSADGVGQLTADVSGTPAQPQISLAVAAQDGKIMAQPFTLARAEMTVDSDKRVDIQRAWLGDAANGHILQGRVDLSGAEPLLDVTLRTKGVRLEPVAALLAPDILLTGNLEQSLRLVGPLSNPSASGSVRLTDGSAYGQLIGEAQVEYTYENGALNLQKGYLTSLDTRVDFSGGVAANGALAINLSASDIDLKRFFMPPEVQLAGVMRFDGRLGGSLSDPIFGGRLEAPKLSVNGQQIDNVVGMMHYQAGVTNIPTFTFGIGSGQYELNLLYEAPTQHYIGRVTAVNGDLTSVFNIARLQDQAIKGELNGDVVFDVQPQNVAVNIDGEVRGGSWRGLPVQQIDLSVALKDRRWTINKLEAQQGAGKLVAQGSADLDGDINIELGGTKLDAALLAAAQKTSVPFGGEMNLFAQVSGKTMNPNVAMSLEISPGRVGTGTFDDLYALITMENKIFKVNQLFIRKGEHQASAYGTVPLAALVSEDGSREAEENPINLRLKLDKADLSILPFLSSEVEWGAGKTTGAVTITGTLNNLRANGDFHVQDGVVRLAKLKQPLEKVNIAIAFDGDKIVLQDCSGQLGTGSFTLTGSTAISGLALSGYDLHLALNHPTLDSSLYKGPVDGNVRLFTKNGQPALEGSLLVNNATINIPLLAKSDLQLPFVYLDGVVKLGDKVRLYNPYLYDLMIGGQIDVKGSTRFPRIGGRVEATRGTVSYLRTPFKIQTAVATWPIPGSFFPAINLTGQTRLSQTVINMGVSGTIDELDLQLSSDPPLSRQEIIYLLTMKQQYQNSKDKTGTSEFGRSEVLGLLDVGLQARFLSELESTVRDALGVDEFRLFSSSVTTDSNGKIKKNSSSSSTDSKNNDSNTMQMYNLEVGKYITDRLMVGYTTSVNRQYYTYKLQYDLTRRINLTFAVDQDRDRWYGVEMRIPF